MIKDTLLAYYYEFADVFLKATLDTLLPLRQTNYRFKLDKGILARDAISYSPLYKILFKELEAVK